MLLRRRAYAFVVAVAASWAALAIAVALWLRVADRGTISYAIGNWPPPWGIEYRVDALNAFALVLVAAIASVVLPYSRKSIEEEVSPQQHYLFYTMFVLCLAGLLGITITGDPILLRDVMEEKFESPEVKEAVRKMQCRKRGRRRSTTRAAN